MVKSGKLKLPKTVAGLKVPKAIRKSGALETLVGSQTGRQILAEALLAAAAAAAAALVQDRNKPEPNGRKAGSRSAMSVATTAAAGAVAEIITGAAQSFMDGSRSDSRKSATSKKAKGKKEPGPATGASGARRADETAESERE